MVRIYDMKQKEVVNIRDGCRLGFICDIEVDLTDGMIKNIIVPGQGKLFGILGREMEYVIAWCQICKIGADIILVDIDTEKAKQTIVELSRLMRYVLYESNNRLISLSKELQFLNHYIELMRIRYTDKVRIDVSFPTDTGEVQVPPLLFVSFVENAFKHGVSYQHASFVSVCLQVVGEEIHFVCSNSNYYRSEDQHHGIGLDNIRKRLRLLFGERYKLSIDDTADCFDVQLLVPVS